IREIEFIVQAYQLVRGGRDPRLQTPSLLEALPHLAAERDLGAAGVERLGAAYRYLRTVENRLQAMDDRQTHVLPVDPEARARLAYAQGDADWAAFTARLAAHRKAVEREFERIAWDGRGPRGADGDGAEAAYQAWE